MKAPVHTIHQMTSEADDCSSLTATPTAPDKLHDRVHAGVARQRGLCCPDELHPAEVLTWRRGP